MTNDQTLTSRTSGELPVVGELALSTERRAELAPKLTALLADLRKLEELEMPELEPAMPWKANDDAGR
jgi:hypothetical protein